jgi:hypothetical protein
MFSWLDPAIFLIRVRRGELTVVRGQVSRRFLEDCEDLITDAGVVRGKIRGVRREGTVSLDFSREIPSALHQRFRNSFYFHRR